jgi:hypothetical protein
MPARRYLLRVTHAGNIPDRRDNDGSALFFNGGSVLTIVAGEAGRLATVNIATIRERPCIGSMRREPHKPHIMHQPQTHRWGTSFPIMREDDG